MKALSPDELTPVGFVVKPFGFKGEVIIGAELTSPEDFPQVEFVFLELDGLPVPFKVSESYLKNGQLIYQFEDIRNEQQAKSLSGATVLIHQDEIKDFDEYLTYDQLRGFKVMDAHSGDLGKIETIDEYPMQLVARCRLNGKEVLFPLNETIVTSIDAKRRIVHTALPDGLVDVYLGGD